MHITVSIHSFNPAFILKPKGNQKILGFFIQFIILSVSLTASYNWTIGVCVNKDTVLVVAHLADVTNSTVVRAAQNLPTCRRSRSFTCLPPVISPPIYFILIQAHILDGRHDISIKSGDSETRRAVAVNALFTLNLDANLETYEKLLLEIIININIIELFKFIYLFKNKCI